MKVLRENYSLGYVLDMVIIISIYNFDSLNHFNIFLKLDVSVRNILTKSNNDICCTNVKHSNTNKFANTRDKSG